MKKWGWIVLGIVVLGVLKKPAAPAPAVVSPPQDDFGGGLSVGATVGTDGDFVSLPPSLIAEGIVGIV